MTKKRISIPVLMALIAFATASLPTAVFAIPVNLATAGTASASSDLGGLFPASRANNGSRAGGSDSDIFQTSVGQTEYWWEVDLGSENFLDRLQIFPSTNATSLSVENFRIDVFDGVGGNVFSDTYQASDSTRDLPWGTSDIRNVFGQRVRITRLDGTPGVMTFAELEVFGQATPIDTNLALGGTVTGTSEGGIARFEDAIDGDINGIFGQDDTSGIGGTNSVYHAAGPYSAGDFWQVDLGSVKTLTNANVFARTDATTNASSIIFEVLADDGVTVNYTDILRIQGTDLGGQRYETEVDLTGIDGRFVKITSRQGGGSKALVLAEVEVFGVPEPSSALLALCGLFCLVAPRRRRG